MPVSLGGHQSPFEHAATTSRETSRPKNGNWIDTFLSAIMQGMSVVDATATAGVHVTLPYQWRTRDDGFKRAWQEAADIGTEFMEQEAARRAYHGTLKPVFHKGVECGHIREYSDTLMIFLLKARKPEKYREGVEDGASRPVAININIVNVDAGQVASDRPVARVPLEAIPVEVIGGNDG